MEWCRLHNVSKYQYYYRQREVKKHAAKQMALQATEISKPVFADVTQKLYSQPAVSGNDQSFSRVSACIRTGNTDILVSDETSEELLVRILRAVRSC